MIVNLCFYEGSDFDSTYEENILIRKEFYDKIEDSLDTDSFVIRQMYGRLSVTFIDIDVQFFSDDEFREWTRLALDDLRSDGNYCYMVLNDICRVLGLDLQAEIDTTQTYVMSLIEN